MRNRHIVFIVSGEGFGGAERQAILLASQLKEKGGFRISFVLFGKARGATLSVLQEHGIPYNEFLIPHQKLLRPLKLLLLLRKMKPDLLMPYTAYPNLYTALIWRFTQASNCIWNQRDEGAGLQSGRMTQFAINRISCFIANSKGAAAHLTTHFSVDASHVTVIYNGVVKYPATVSRKDWRLQHGIEENAFLITMIANLTQYKDHATLIRAVSKLAKSKQGQTVKLVLAGKKGDRYEYLNQLAAENNISDQVIFLGSVSDIGNVLQATDLAVLSSRSEGLPNGILEAMAAGVAVTGTKIPGIVEALGASYMPYLAEPGDAESMAQNILFFMNNPAKRAELIATNLQRVESLFSVQSLYHHTLQYLNDK